MATEDKSRPKSSTKPKKRKYLPHGKPVKKKGAYPLHPGVQGFFITCDGGRERQAAHEAINLLENFCDELIDGEDSISNCKKLPKQPLNKKITFADSDASGSDDDSQPDENKDGENQSLKKQRTNVDVDADAEKCESNYKSEAKSTEESRVVAEVKRESHNGDKEKFVDELIEEELRELGDRNKRLFVSLDSGCNGVIFIQMHKRAVLPSPSRIAEQLLSLAASTRKHTSRFILRVLPVEVSCYASEEEITKAIGPLVSEYFPSDSPTALKFSVLYDSRANSGVDRMKIINAVAKSVPQPHKVDLNNPDQSIIVQIVKTFCLVGVVRRYKELAKYNLRQLTSPQS